MAKYFKQDHLKQDQILPRPPLEPLEALEVAKAQPIINVFRAQDRVVTLGRRILCEQNINGNVAWLVPDTNTTSASQTHPLKDTVRYIARARVELTPGCMLRISVLCGPSGFSQRDDTPAAPPWRADGGGGTIGFELTWRDSAGGSTTTTHEIQLPASPFDFGAATDGTAESQWGTLRVLELANIVPESLVLASNANQWSLPTTLDIAIYNVGGARVLDAAVFEEPKQITMEADDTSNRWCSHVYGSSGPGGPGPKITHAVQRLSEVGADGDPRGGTWHLMDVANNQALRLGPQLIQFSSWDESGLNATEPTPFSSTSSSFAGIPNASITSYDAANQGWSLSTGGYAAPYKHNHARAVGNNRVIPVRVRCYARGGTATTGVFRIQSAVDSYIEITIPAGTSYGWNTMYGYLRCGQGPGDDSCAQAFLRRASGANTVELLYFDVYRSGNVAVPA